MATKADIVRLAFARLGQGVTGDTIAAHEMALGMTLLDSAFQELQEEALAPWSLEQLPDEALSAMSMLLAAELAPSFSLAPPVSRARAKLRVLALMRPDDRPGETVVEYY